VEFVPLEAIASDAAFKLREEGDVSTLASSIGRLGQLVPIELRSLPVVEEEGLPLWQVVAGFRRVAALRLLQRDRVLARVHRQLSDEDAWGLALGQALLTEPLLEAELESLRQKILESNQASWAYDLVDEALVRAPVDPELRERLFELLRPSGEAGPGSGGDAQEGPSDGAAGAGPDEEVEVTADELADDLTARLYELSQDLATAFEVWSDLPADGRSRILEQMRYIADLLPLLERKP
jgi:ParB family chromosome partitioning protein